MPAGVGDEATGQVEAGDPGPHYSFWTVSTCPPPLSAQDRTISCDSAPDGVRPHGCSAPEVLSVASAGRVSRLSSQPSGVTAPF